MTATTVQKFHCGEVFVMTNFCTILECKTCKERFGVYTKFLDHIFEKHFDDYTAAEKSKVATKELTTIATEQDLIELPTDDQYVEIDSTTLKEFSFEGDEHDLITEVLTPTESDVMVVEENIEQEGKPTTKILNPNVRQLRVCASSSKSSEGVKKYKCRICGFLVSGAHNLRGHEQRHSNIKPFACLTCDKAFYTSTELNTHTRRHNGEKPFICPYCGKGFTTAGMVTAHERRHKNERLYKCDQCEKRFYEPAQVRRHAVVHSQERNFLCEECNAKFTRKKTLQTHKKLHENALRYECIICHMRFNQRPTLLWHVKSKHNVLSKDADGKGSAQFNSLIGAVDESA